MSTSENGATTIDEYEVEDVNHSVGGSATKKAEHSCGVGIAFFLTDYLADG